MLARSKVSLALVSMLAAAGVRAITQEQVYAHAGDNVNLAVAGILAGIYDRTATGNTTDVLPDVDAIVAAVPELSVGDSFKFTLRQLAAFTTTLTAGTGMTLVGTTTIAASFCRDYLITMQSTKRTTIQVGMTTNANKNLTGFTAAQLALIEVGMGVTGTGIGASAVVDSINFATGTVHVTVDSTATSAAPGVAITFFPRCTVKGLGTYGI